MKYQIKNGKLVTFSVFRHSMLCCMLMLLFFMTCFNIVVHFMSIDNMIITKYEYKNFIDLDTKINNLEIENEKLMYFKQNFFDLRDKNEKLQRLSVYDSENQLRILFDTIFLDVKLSEKEKSQYIVSIANNAECYGLPPVLIAAIIWKESNFDRKTKSKAGAKGPMQVIYKWHKEKFKFLKKHESDSYDIDTSVKIGCWIFREYYDESDRDVFIALYRYLGSNRLEYAKEILKKYIDSKVSINDVLFK